LIRGNFTETYPHIRIWAKIGYKFHVTGTKDYVYLRHVFTIEIACVVYEVRDDSKEKVIDLYVTVGK
jgi:hypothetical protein